MAEDGSAGAGSYLSFLLVASHFEPEYFPCRPEATRRMQVACTHRQSAQPLSPVCIQRSVAARRSEGRLLRAN